LICGRNYSTCRHSCSKMCHDGSKCPPCNQRCEVHCSHSRCGKPCHEPCAPCAEKKCQSNCAHTQCTMPCAAPCNWVPCSRRCENMLSCGHQCEFSNLLPLLASTFRKLPRRSRFACADRSRSFALWRDLSRINLLPAVRIQGNQVHLC
jgi:hypothetical protein